METIAVYWEENIKTYGIRKETKLCLVQMDILPVCLVEQGQQLAELGQGETKVRLILAHHHEPGLLRLYMVFENRWQGTLADFFSRPDLQEVSGRFLLESPVEMLNFHGPHFGDRYGIADMACDALKKENIRFMLMGCSAASVHFIFPEKMAARAEKALGSVFKAP